MEPWVNLSKRFPLYLVTFVPSDFMLGDEWKSYAASAFEKTKLERATQPRRRVSRRTRNVPGYDSVTIYADSMEDALQARGILHRTLRASGRENAVAMDLTRPRQSGFTKGAPISKAWTTFSNTLPNSSGATAVLAPGEGDSLLPKGLLNNTRKRKRRQSKTARRSP
jgi:hypothetical protein